MSKNLLLTLKILTLTTGMSFYPILQCMAQEKKWEIGPLLGLSQDLVEDDSEGFGISPTLGFTANFKWGSHLRVGTAVLYTSFNHTQIELKDLKEDQYQILANAQYHLTEGLPGLWAGARAGLGIYQLETNNGVALNQTQTWISRQAFTWGPCLGYDLSLTHQVSLGIDLSYLISRYPSKTVFSNQTLPEITLKSLNALVALKLSF